MTTRGRLAACAFFIWNCAAAMGAAQFCGINVQTDPPQAALSLDRKAQGLTPLVVNALPGEHLVIVTKDGYVEARRTVTVQPGQTTLPLSIRLEPLTGLVLVQSDPAGADVTVDGALRGQTPLLMTDLPLGEYRVTVSMQGYLPTQKALKLEDRTPQKLEVRLQPDSGVADVSSDPPGAEIFINGISRGQTPGKIVNIPPGENEIRLTMGGYREYGQTFRLKTGEELSIAVVLEPLPGKLFVYSIPSNANVYVSDQFRGVSPLEVEPLEHGEYTVRVELQGFEPLARSVTVGKGSEVREEFRLERNAGLLQIATQPAGVKVFVDGEDKGVTATAEGESDAISDPMLVDLLAPGKHAVTLTRKGYETMSVDVIIDKNRTTSLTPVLKKLFIPDTLIRTGTGPDDVHIGVLLRKYENGDVRLEWRPGVERLFRKSEIVAIEPYAVDGGGQ